MARSVWGLIMELYGIVPWKVKPLGTKVTIRNGKKQGNKKGDSNHK